MKLLKPILLAGLALFLTIPAFAEDPEYRLVIKNHQFTPENIEIPAGQKIRLVIENQDATPEEFESHPLNREKIVPANGKAIVYLGPLEPGRYPFVGEFHSKTAKGNIIVK